PLSGRRDERSPRLHDRKEAHPSRPLAEARDNRRSGGRLEVVAGRLEARSPRRELEKQGRPTPRARSLEIASRRRSRDVTFFDAENRWRRGDEAAPSARLPFQLLSEGAALLGGPGRNVVHERRRKAIIGLELQFPEARPNGVHLRRIIAALDD